MYKNTNSLFFFNYGLPCCDNVHKLGRVWKHKILLDRSQARYGTEDVRYFTKFTLS